MEQSELPPGVAARVGSDEVEVELVRAIAAAQSVSLTEARGLAISDALFAEHARQRLRGTGLVESAERAGLSRALLEQIRDEAKQKGPPTDAEVEAITRDRWFDLDRPSLARTVHVVVRVVRDDQREHAERVARRIAEALSGIRDATEFETRAKALDADGLDKQVEALPPVAADGRVATPGAPAGTPPTRFDEAFARAANAIPSVGDQSPVVETKFGFHVILLVEKIAPNVLSLEQRRKVVALEVEQRRASAISAELLEARTKVTPVGIERNAVGLLSELQVGQ